MNNLMKESNNSSQIEVKENAEGDLYFQFTDDLLKRMDWKEGDEVKFIEQEEGFIIKKIKYETIELDFTEKELYKYMLIAHENKMSLDEWIESALESMLKDDRVKEWQNKLYDQEGDK